MLAGPPRIVQLLTALFLLGLGLWYLRLAPSLSTPSGLHLDNRPPPPALRPYPAPGSQKHDVDSSATPDFSVPLRFTEGAAKPVGENYSWVVVVPKTLKEDLSWLKNEVPDSRLVVYEVDDPRAVNRIPKNKGREAMVYLTYLIDHYDELPDTVIFLHSHSHAWHNNQLMGLSSTQLLKYLNHDRVARLGYMSLRCHHAPGCPDWIHLDRPGGDFDFFLKPEEPYIRRHIWEELHPGAPIPSSLSGICCAQFAVSRERIRQVPLERFLHYRKWLLTTSMDDQYSGRVFEYLWHYIFTGHEVYCPAMNTCYCDGYGFCFGGRSKFEEFFTKQDHRNTLNEELRTTFIELEEKATEEGRTIEWDDAQEKRMDELRKEIGQLDLELNKSRKEALERGKDPANRAKETENWNSDDIFDYLPGGPKGPAA